MATSGDEAAPLLPPGRHVMAWEQLQQITVDTFPDSMTRFRIWRGIRFIVERLEEAGIDAEIWVDGSFVTEKPDPADADMVFWVPFGQYQHGTHSQRDAIEWLSENLRGVLACDTYIAFHYPEEHPGRERMAERQEYWQALFGTGRLGTPKGIAVVHIGTKGVPHE
jgi:hypothetical protein